ncbi:acyltransferase [Myroides odoratimimus]|uniref:acyltransferase n=1 Tax=Myroides odoratimimus TaxID=76832 RepID=UPI002DB5981B|nr:acyltransferase [Myroides odoratimimus]MEC4028765.1 acyltransferase [Myroides odoratimimus]
MFPQNIILGDYVYLGPGGMINAMGGVEICTGTIIGPNFLILSANHNFNSKKLVPYDETHILKKVTIGVGCWIGANVILTPGTTIGKGVIIGAGAVVSGIIPDYSIVVGNPAKIIKQRDKEQFDLLISQEAYYLKSKNGGIIKPNFDGI